MANPEAATPDAAGTHAPAVRPVISPDSGAENEAAAWQAAAQIRKERPGWVVIWLARKGEFRARPLFRAPPDTVAIGTTPEELKAQMDNIEQAAGRPKQPAHV
jgi:hypothetical protein